MATEEKDPGHTPITPKVVPPGGAWQLALEPLSEFLSYGFVAAWCNWFQFKASYLIRILAAFIFVCSLVELLAPHIEILAAHSWDIYALFLQYTKHQSAGDGKPLAEFLKFQVVTFLIVATSASVMFAVHHHLEARQRSLRRLMLFAANISEFVRKSEGEQVENRLSELLGELVRVLSKDGDRNQSELNATILVPAETAAGQVPGFRVLAQDPNGKFELKKPLPRAGSVAGNLLGLQEERKSDSLLIYVPWTRIPHGVSFDYRYDPDSAAEPVDRMDAVLDAFVSIPGQKLGCVLCARISGISSHSTVGDCAILSLSSPRPNFMGQSEIDGVRLLSKVLWQVLEPNRQ